MREFQNLTVDCNLSDLAYIGSLFTWCNNCPMSPVSKKLNRALINADWLSSFPQSFAKFDVGGISDHARCLIHISPQEVGAHKPFKFFNFLADHDEFLPVVKRVWDTS
ncbi:unnamed protein product [Microthlaspi erraticum]|uniref:Endonuclease/exonuclease/phosphatase domain-containing protein n=1 Tax=Microthlaspi erraticum TaxID=1685480 RepID=A0A6D2IXT3_9BRAS|nr:unnamed protein product [Microthlaspi erraticum]